MRLNKRVSELIKNGKVFSKGRLTVYYLPRRGEKICVFYSLSKKIYTSVQRNYIKRLVREALRKTDVPYDLLVKVAEKNIDFNVINSFFTSFKELFSYEDSTNSCN